MIPLEWNDGLYLAANDHCKDAGTNGLVSWLGSDESNPATRMARYGTSGPSQGQNLAYGSSHKALDIILQLLIDDGAPSRTSRLVMLNPTYELTGVASCAHKTRTMMTSILYTDYFSLNNEGKNKISMMLQSNPPVLPSGPEIIPSTQVRPLVRGVDAALDKAIYYWQNKLRTDPSELIESLTKFEADFNSTSTEPKAVTKALEALKLIKEEGLPALEWSEALNLAAKEHCNDIGPKGLVGHFGTDKSSPFDRIKRFGKPGWWRGENLSFNTFGVPADKKDVDKLAKEVVMTMFIDEGVAGRPNRSRMLNPEFKLVGIYSCPHKDNSMSVLNYAGSIEENDRTTQGVMAATEKGASAASPATLPVKSNDLPKPKRCTDLPSSVVSRDTCGYFDIVNEIRQDPKGFIKTLEARQ